VIAEPERLHEHAELFRLLTHYASLGAEDRETWRDRVMEQAPVAPRELSRLHGELIAQGWVEQNTGLTPVLKAGCVSACYRVTSAGLKAYRHACKEAAEPSAQDEPATADD
jgi:hypothetical protein